MIFSPLKGGVHPLHHHLDPSIPNLNTNPLGAKIFVTKISIHMVKNCKKKTEKKFHKAGS